MDIGVDEQKVIIEIIASLVNIKATLVEKILKPSGVPERVYGPVFRQIDPIMGGQISKRKAAPLILDGIKDLPNKNEIEKEIIRIASVWTDFSLAKDEYLARATVQKAREAWMRIQQVEENEEIQREISHQTEEKRIVNEKRIAHYKEAALLLEMFDDLSRDKDHQRRGFLLQDLLPRLFLLNDLAVWKSFTRNEGGEQIDGAFQFEGWYYIVECRWREKPADIRQLDGLLGQVNRSGKQLLGMFLSMSGWSENVVNLLKQNPDKSVFLMDGYDLRCVLSGEADLRDFLKAKIARLNLGPEPFLSVKEFLNR